MLFTIWKPVFRVSCIFSNISKRWKIFAGKFRVTPSWLGLCLYSELLESRVSAKHHYEHMFGDYCDHLGVVGTWKKISEVSCAYFVTAQKNRKKNFRKFFRVFFTPPFRNLRWHSELGTLGRLGKGGGGKNPGNKGVHLGVERRLRRAQKVWRP